MKIYNNIKWTDAIFHGHKDYRPYFCYCINPYKNYNENRNSLFGLGFVKSNFSGFSKDCELTNGENPFTIKEIEVFKILFE